MPKDDLIEAGAMSLRTMPDDLPPMDRTTHARFISASVINAVEPLIRADERTLIGANRGLDMPQIEARIKANGERIRDATQAAVLADLRARVEALPGNDPFQSPERRAAYEYAIENVLDLIDGEET
jgi:hypothetical protein